MMPFTTSLLPLSFLVPLEIAQAYAEAFLPTSSTVSPKPPAPPNRVPSDQSTNSAKAMSTQFYDTQVATVNYQILFTKRDNEALLDCGRVIVASAMASSGFASWQISLFIQKLNKKSTPLTVTDGIPKPEEWSDEQAIELAAEVFPVQPSYCHPYCPPYCSPPASPPCPAKTEIQRVIGLRPENLKYLQVDYQIISAFDRKPPRYDADQVNALRQIAAAIKNKC
jgi:hypothetical protein